MIRVYIAENLADAHLVYNRIQVEGISAHVFNEHTHGAVGELPFTHTWPEVWIENDDDESRALEIIEATRKASVEEGEIACPKCDQINPINFEICWNCSEELVTD